MDPGAEGRGWVRVHERKLIAALDTLERLHQRVLEGRESAEALQRQSTQASRRARQLLADAARLTAEAEVLVADARAIHAEHTALPADDPAWPPRPTRHP